MGKLSKPIPKFFCYNLFAIAQLLILQAAAYCQNLVNAGKTLKLRKPDVSAFTQVIGSTQSPWIFLQNLLADYKSSRTQEKMREIHGHKKEKNNS